MLVDRRRRRPTPSQRCRFLRSPKRSSSFSPRCLFALDFVLRARARAARARAARALGTRSLRRLETSTLLLSTITATQAQRSKPTKSTYTWGKAGTLKTWSSTNGGRDRGVVQSPYPVLLATYPPSPLSPSLSRAIATLTCLFARHLQASRTYARARCTPPPPLNSLSHSLHPSVRPRPSALGASVRPSALNSTHSIPRSLARSLSVVVSSSSSKTGRGRASAVAIPQLRGEEEKETEGGTPGGERGRGRGRGREGEGC